MTRGSRLPLALALLLGCSSGVPTSVLLTITAVPPAPDAVQVRAFGAAAPAQELATFPVAAASTDGRLGTVVIYGTEGALRVEGQGLRQGQVISQGTAQVELSAGRQTSATLALVTSQPADGDGGRPDGSQVPDVLVTGGPDAGPRRDAAVDLAPGGTVCTGGDQCGSGFCTEGVCCEAAACGGPCRSCHLPGSAGLCRDIPADGDPGPGGCAPEPVGTCGRTGKCDGMGQCQRQPNGLMCAPARCSDAREVPPSTCQGGRCVAGRGRDCPNGFGCDGEVCATACTRDDQCSASTYCVAPACKPSHGDGTSCARAAECSSGWCTDAHCCPVPECAPGTYCGGPGGLCINKKFPGDPSPCTAGYECVSGNCKGTCQ